MAPKAPPHGSVAVVYWNDAWGTSDHDPEDTLCPQVSAGIVIETEDPTCVRLAQIATPPERGEELEAVEARDFLTIPLSLVTRVEVVRKKVRTAKRTTRR